MTKDKKIKFYTSRIEKIKSGNFRPATLKYAELQLDAVKNDENEFSEHLGVMAQEYERNMDCIDSTEIQQNKMVKVILTTCGKSITKSVKMLDEMSRKHARDAMIGCGTDDYFGNYVEIKDVYFIIQ